MRRDDTDIIVLVVVMVTRQSVDTKHRNVFATDAPRFGFDTDVQKMDIFGGRIRESSDGRPYE